MQWRGIVGVGWDRWITRAAIEKLVASKVGSCFGCREVRSITMYVEDHVTGNEVYFDIQMCHTVVE